MPEYLIEVPHTAEECLAAFDQFLENPRADELLKSTYAACNSGTHIAWTIAPFADEDEARAMMSVPSVQKKMKIYPVDIFTADEVRAAHES